MKAEAVATEANRGDKDELSRTLKADSITILSYQNLIDSGIPISHFAKACGVINAAIWKNQGIPEKHRGACLKLIEESKAVPLAKAEPDRINPLMVSGIGQYHTNEPGKAERKDYLSIDSVGIQSLVDNPQQCDKTQAQWLIPSALLSRNFKQQETDGQFWLLWCDFDKQPPTLPDLQIIVENLLSGADYELYNSRGATVENQKARLLVPLSEPLSGADWMLTQEILNDKFESLGTLPDRASERAAQLCYLPNRGAFYGRLSKRDGHCFNPSQTWTQEIATKRGKLEAAMAALEATKQDTMAKKSTLKLSDAPNLIAAFNLAYTPQEFLLQAGYSQRGNTFCHPNSESGSYSCGVQMNNNGELRAHTLSTNDPLYVKGSKSGHDAFSFFTVLIHGGDRDAALRDAGDNLLAIGGVPYNKAVRYEHMQQQAALQQQQQKANTPPPRDQPVFTGDIDISTVPEFPPIGYEKPPTPKQSEDKTPFTLARFSISGKSSEMRKQMLGTTYVIERLAIRGQSTVIYAKYNTGKTLLVLWGLSQSIEKGIIEGSDIYYINADDDFDGLTTKTEIAEQYGFHMLTPGFEGFSPSSMQGYLRQMIADGTAEKSVLILDTLKKFTDQMDKKGSSAFMSRVGEFITAKGTVIMLSHVNKSRDEHGKVVHCGTSDVPDDASCVFTLDEVSTSQGIKQVLFENIKNRGVVAKELAFSYSVEEGQTYRQIFDSVKVETAASSFQAKAALDESIKAARDKQVIDSIIQTLKADIVKKTELIKAVQEDTGISKPRITTVLNNYCGKKWQVVVGDRNAKTYSILTMNQSTESEYRRYKDGE